MLHKFVIIIIIFITHMYNIEVNYQPLHQPSNLLQWLIYLIDLMVDNLLLEFYFRSAQFLLKLNPLLLGTMLKVFPQSMSYIEVFFTL